jgi:hypothetical protein
VIPIQQEIAAAGDATVLVYREETSPEDVTRDGIAPAMKQGIKDKTAKLMIKLGKMTAVANPTLGPEFLEEVGAGNFNCFTVSIGAFISVADELNCILLTDRKALEFECIAIGVDSREASAHCNELRFSSSQASMVEVVELLCAYKGGGPFSYETGKRRTAQFLYYEGSMVGRGECSLHHAHRGTLYDVVPWCNCFKNWNGQLVVSGPSPLSRGAGIGNSLLLQCPYSVPWSPSGQVSHGSMACVAR